MCGDGGMEGVHSTGTAPEIADGSGTLSDTAPQERD